MIGTLIFPVLTTVYIASLQINPTSPQLATQGSYSSPQTCADVGAVFDSAPNCSSRNTLVKLELPLDPNVIEVLPTAVEVARCGGTCHNGVRNKKCIPVPEGISMKTVNVQFVYAGNVSQSHYFKCATVQVESHRECACGCDLSPTNCDSPNKVSFPFDF